MSEVRFLCPFCPPAREPGVVHAAAGDGEDETYVVHSLPTCSRYDAIDEDEPESFANFLADCRKKLAETAPS